MSNSDDLLAQLMKMMGTGAAGDQAGDTEEEPTPLVATEDFMERLVRCEREANGC